jgi:hypothetical protein
MTEGLKHDSPGSALLEQLVPPWRDALPPSVSRAYFDGFVARNRAQLIHRLDALARAVRNRAALHASPRRRQRSDRGAGPGRSSTWTASSSSCP